MEMGLSASELEAYVKDHGRTHQIKFLGQLSNVRIQSKEYINWLTVFALSVLRKPWYGL